MVYGVFENLAQSVVGAVDMLKTFALAEYWDSLHGRTSAARIRAQVSMMAFPGIGMGLAATSALASRFFMPAFEKKAEDAFKEREAIIEAVKHVFTNSKDFLGKLTDGQVVRFRQFTKCMGEESLAGSFEAGTLLGELLFDVLMVIDLAAGLAKLALQVPKLARFAEDFAKLAGDLRTAKRLQNAAKTSELAEPPPKTARSQNSTSGETGRSSGNDRAPPPPSPPQPPPPPDPEPKPLPERSGPLYDDPSEAVKDRVATLKDAIPENSKGRITMAAAVVEDQDGARSMLISTSEPRGYLRPGVELDSNEILVPGTGHAEADIVSYANANKLTVVDIGATRPVCPDCADAIAPTGANISTPLKGGP